MNLAPKCRRLRRRGLRTICASRRFANDSVGHGAFVNWAGQPDIRIVYEPTGPYHRAFERRLAASGCALVKVSPRQARRFAEATGRLAKTDRLDAAMLARMGALLDLEARPVHSPTLNDLKDLHMAREALVKSRTAAKNRAKTLTLPILKRHNAEQLRQIERQMAAIEKEIMALIQAATIRPAASHRRQTIKGRHNRHHAKTRRPRQRPDQGRP